MKTKTKSLAILLAVVLVMNMLLPSFAFAIGDDITVGVGSTTVEANTGIQDVTVPVTIENNPGIAALLMEFSVNSEALTLKSATAAGALCAQELSSFTPTISTKIVYWENPFGNMTEDGILFFLTFTVDTSVIGEHQISIVPETDDPFVGYDFDVYFPDYTAGSITVADTTPPVPTTYAVTFPGLPAGAPAPQVVGMPNYSPSYTADASGAFNLVPGDYYYVVQGPPPTYDTYEAQFTVVDEDIAFDLFSPPVPTEDYIISGPRDITLDGAYTVQAGATGVVNIAAGAKVTLVGGGVDTAANVDLRFEVGEGTELTIKNLWLLTSSSYFGNLINFIGGSNKLLLDGVNMIEGNYGGSTPYYATIRVANSTVLEIGGTGTLYFYKSAVAAGIGSNGDNGSGEPSGTIIFNGGNLFIKGSKTGAVIGSGGNYTANAVVGDVYIKAGTININAKAQGAGIGGGAKASGGNVYMTGGNVTITSDFNGPAIGRGNGGSTNGNLYISGGSLKTVVTTNAVVSVPAWVAGINDTNIVATKTDANDNPVYQYAFDTADLDATTFNVAVDGTNFYSGGLHVTDWVNDNNSTIGNWIPSSDTNLYLYLTGANHTLTVNGEDYNLVWDGDSSSFVVAPPPAVDLTLWDGTIDTSWYNSTDTTFTLTTAAQFAGLAAIVNNKQPTSAAGAVTGINTTIPADDFLGKTVILDANLDLGGVEVTKGSISGTTYTVPVWSGLTWTPIGSNTGSADSQDGARGRPFKGTFDGGYHTISNMYARLGTVSESTALFGELGQLGTVKNIIIASGFAYGDRYTAGVVGRSWGRIENCANFASVETTGDRSGGGIAGVSFNNGNHAYIINCYNAGTIFKGDRRYGGGITGDNEGTIENCFNIGTGIQKFSPYDVMSGINGGQHSSTGKIVNSYSITGEGYPKVIDNGKPTQYTDYMVTTEFMQTNAFVLLLGDAFNVVEGGFPVLAGQGIGTPAVPEIVDKSALEALFDLLNSGELILEEEAYTTESWAAAALAAEAALAVYLDADATQAEVDTALANLLAAIDALELLPAAVDKTALGEAITAIAEPEDGNFPLEEDYTAESWAPFETAVLAAVSVYQDDDATQAEVDTALANLLATFDALELLPPSYGQPWTGAVDTSWYSDDVNSFVIYTAEQFAGLSALVDSGKAFTGKTVTLGANIDLAKKPWSAIGSAVAALVTYTSPINNVTQTSISSITDASLPFNGTFDGAGFSISNFAINVTGGGQALFAYLGSGGFVGNFTITGTVATTATGDCDYIAGIVAYNRGTISCVTSNVDVNGGGDNTYNVAGIAGFNDGRAGTPGGAVGYIYGCINNGAIQSGRNKVGGIVGQNAGTVESCANTGIVTALNAASKNGVGGIVGRNGNNNSPVEQGIVNNCYNTGMVGINGQSWVGGIVGFQNQLSGITNCYSVGERGSNYTSYVNPIVGQREDNPNRTINNYSLNTITATGSVVEETGIRRTAEDMKSAEFLAEINAGGRAYIKIAGVNNDYPVLRAHYADTSTFVNVTKNSDPTKLEYAEGQVFSMEGFEVWANFSDGTHEVVKDIKVNITRELAITDTSIAITATYNGEPIVFTYPITVVANKLDFITVTTQPQNKTYAVGEAFNPAGLAVRATYTNGKTAVIAVENYTWAPLTLSDTDTEVVISYTEGDVTKTASIAVTMLAGSAPTLNDDGFYELKTVSDLLWYANQVNTGVNVSINGKLMNNIDLSGTTWTPIGSSTAGRQYKGTFDGNGKAVTLAHTSTASYQGFFGYMAADSSVKDLTVDGTLSSNSSYLGAIAGYAISAKIINCVSNAAVTGTNTNVGGIVGSASGVTVTDTVNKGAVSSSANYVGGIVGYLTASTIKDCVNDGAITGTIYAGGIAGGITNVSNVTGCVNNAAVTGTYYNGGIAGYTSGADKITMCANNGDITATLTTTTVAYGVGGIVGGINAAGLVDSCVNTGNVTGTLMSVGGIVGYIAAATGVVTNSYNTGGVTSTASSANATVGGIVGRVNNASGTVKNTFNTGTVSYITSTYAAGVVGYAAGITNIANNFFLDTVADKALGFNTAYTSANAAAVDAEALAELAETLGAAFKTGENTPILTWEPDYTPEPPVVTGDYTFTLVADKEHYNVGETMSVDVVVSSEVYDNIRIMQLLMEFDNSVLGFPVKKAGSPVEVSKSKTSESQFILDLIAGNILLEDGECVIVTLEFLVLGGFEENSEATVGMVANGGNTAEPQTLHPLADPPTIELGENITKTLCNLTVTFVAGEGVEDFDPVVAHVKYGESTLYTDTTWMEEITLPELTAETGYENPVWNDYTEGMTFTESAVITATATKLTYTVTFYGKDGSVVDTQTVKYGEFATTPAAPTVPGMGFEGWFVVASADAPYDDDALLAADAIDAAAVTANISYKAYYVVNMFEITIPENVTIVSGVTTVDDVNYATKGTDITFEVDFKPGHVAVVNVTIGGVTTTLTPDGDGVYTIDGDIITGEVTIEVTYLVDGVITFIENEDYYAAPEGYKVMLLTPVGDPIENATYKYGDTSFLWSEKYNAYVTMVDENLTAELAIKDITAEVIGVVSLNITIDYSGDLLTPYGTINIRDAQFVYDLYQGTYNDGFDPINVTLRLMADVNGDKAVDMQDVIIIREIARSI